MLQVWRLCKNLEIIVAYVNNYINIYLYHISYNNYINPYINIVNGYVKHDNKNQRYNILKDLLYVLEMNRTAFP